MFSLCWGRLPVYLDIAEYHCFSWSLSYLVNPGKPMPLGKTGGTPLQTQHSILADLDITYPIPEIFSQRACDSNNISWNPRNVWHVILQDKRGCNNTNFKYYAELLLRINVLSLPNSTLQLLHNMSWFISEILYMLFR